MSQLELPPKKDVVLALLERSTVFIHLDPRASNVVVPAWFKKQAQLVLQIGLSMPVPIRDLVIDDAGIHCTLSFNRSPHYCDLPWSAIFGVAGEDGRGLVWPDDVPSEVSVRPVGNATAKGARAREAPSPRPRARSGRTGAQARKRGAAGLDGAGGREPETARSPQGLKLLSADTPQPVEPSGIKTAPAQALESARGAGAQAKDSSDQAPTPGKRTLPPYLRVVK